MNGVQTALLVETAEKALYAQLEQVAPRVQSQLAAREYTGALSALAALRESVDTFFNDVMVNAEDPALRANRLALLDALHQQMNCVADISPARRLSTPPWPQAQKKLVVLDRDGVINVDSDAFIKSPDEWVALPGSLEAIARLNQPAIASRSRRINRASGAACSIWLR